MRATGVNPRMAEAQGIAHPGRHLCRHGAEQRAGGARRRPFAQTNGFADVTIGTGTIVVGLAAVIVGETVLPLRGVVGAVLRLRARLDPLPDRGRAGAGRRTSSACRPPTSTWSRRCWSALALILPAGRGPLRALLRAGNARAMIQVEDLEVTFGRGTSLEKRALRGVDLAIAGRPVRHRDRHQRRRQVDAPERARRRRAGQPRPHPRRRPRRHRRHRRAPAPGRSPASSRTRSPAAAPSLTIEENLALAEARGRRAA